MGRQQQGKLSIEVVIPVYRDTNRLKKCLLGFCEQTYKQFSLTVVNDGGDRSVEDVVKSFSKELDVRYEYLGPPSKAFRASKARNIGIMRSEADRVICFDQDMIPLPNVVEKHATYKDQKIIVAGLRKRVKKDFAESIFDNNSLDWNKLDANVYADDDRYNSTGWRKKRSSKFAVMFRQGKKFPELCISCNISYPVKECKIVGGFWEEMVGWGREDAEFATRLCRAGCTTLLDPSIVGYHLDHDSNVDPQAVKENEARYRETVNSSIMIRNKIF